MSYTTNSIWKIPYESKIKPCIKNLTSSKEPLDPRMTTPHPYWSSLAPVAPDPCSVVVVEASSSGPEHRHPSRRTTIGCTRPVLYWRRPHLHLAHVGAGTVAPPRAPRMAGAHAQIWEEETETAEGSRASHWGSEWSNFIRTE